MGLGRREVLRRLVGTLGAGFTLPALDPSHPMHAHLADYARVDVADAQASAGGEPEFLDAHQMETLAALAEQILPGSTAAQVAPFVDRLLAVDTPENQRCFVDALAALDHESVARHQSPWTALAAAQAVDLLTAASTTTRAVPHQPPTLRDRFDHVKGWIVGAYYSSEIGMRELGFTGNVFFETFPGCEHPEGHD